MSSAVGRLDPEDPEVRETLREMAMSGRKTAPVYAQLYRDWYGEEPTVTGDGES